MKLLLCLTAMCISLSLCSGYCYMKGFEAHKVDGQWVAPVECEDSSDGTKHPIGSVWNSAQCMRCSCGTYGLSCCSRYGGLASSPGCKAVLDLEECKYKLYRLDDPTKPCFPEAS